MSSCAVERYIFFKVLSNENYVSAISDMDF